MKRLLPEQLTNIIFILLVVGAALAIYFMSHAQSKATGEAASSSSPSPTAAVSQEIDTHADTKCGGVPEAVWLTHLQSAESYTIEPVSESERTWSILFGSDPAVSAQLSYTVNGGLVSSVELAFALPETYDADSDSAIERYLASSEEAALSARDEAVRVLLSDLLPACDANDAVSVSTVLIWAEAAIQIEDADDDFNDDENGVVFLSYRTQRKDETF